MVCKWEMSTIDVKYYITKAGKQNMSASEMIGGLKIHTALHELVRLWSLHGHHRNQTAQTPL